MPRNQTQAVGGSRVASVKQRSRQALCLFSSAGIGELGIEDAGIRIACANEILPYRAALYRENFPGHNLIEGNIWEVKNQIIAETRGQLDGDELFLVYATPPCQGMSTNGIGRLRWEVAKGRRAEEDERNRLIIPTADVLCALRPRWVLLENVRGMRNTWIRDEHDNIVNVIDYLRRRLGPEYVGGPEVVACEDYGIPQSRRRLVTIFTRDERGAAFFRENAGTFFVPSMREPLRTLRDAISHLPRLDATDGENAKPDFHAYHYVAPVSRQKYWWIENTPEGETAFSNQCVNPSCGFQGNDKYRDIHHSSVNKRRSDPAIHCKKCGSLLPRPVVMEAPGRYRALRGFHSAYRRMKWDEPGRTLTQNFIYEASDNKLHPEQNRVLSVLEAMILQTIDRYQYKFTINGRDIGRARIAEVIGESVPPYLIKKICAMMVANSDDEGAP